MSEITTLVVDGVDITFSDSQANIMGIVKDMKSDGTTGKIEFPETAPINMKNILMIKDYLEWLANENNLKFEYHTTKYGTKKYNFLEFEEEFFKKYTDTEICSLVETSNFLNIERLTSACCAFLARLLVGSTGNDINELLNIPDDLSNEEKEKIKLETSICSANE